MKINLFLLLVLLLPSTVFAKESTVPDTLKVGDTIIRGNDTLIIDEKGLNLYKYMYDSEPPLHRISIIKIYRNFKEYSLRQDEKDHKHSIDLIDLSIYIQYLEKNKNKEEENLKFGSRQGIPNNNREIVGGIKNGLDVAKSSYDLLSQIPAKSLIKSADNFIAAIGFSIIMSLSIFFKRWKK